MQSFRRCCFNRLFVYITFLFFGGFLFVSGQATINPTLSTGQGGTTATITICENTAVTFTAAPGNGAPTSTYAYNFFRIRGVSAPVSVQNGASTTYTTTDVLNGDMFFARATGTGPSALGTTTRIEVNVQARIDPGIISNAAQTICGTLPSDLVLINTGSGNIITYQWQQSNDRNVWANIAGATTTILSFPQGAAWIPTLTTYYRVVVTNVDVVTCTSISNLTTVTVQNTAGVALTSDSSSGNTFCDGDSATLTATGGGTYQFYINNVSVQGPGAQSTYTYAAFTNTVTASVIVRNGACSIRRDIRLIKDDLNAGTISGVVSACFGGDAAFTSTASGTINGVAVRADSTTNYQWQSSTDNSNWNDILQGTTNTSTYTAVGLTQTTYFRRKLVSISNGKSCEVYTNPILVNVAPDLRGATITPPTQTVCIGDTPTMLTVTGGAPSGAGISYQWQQSIDSGGTFTDISGAIGINYTPPSTLTSTTQFRRATQSTRVPSCIEYSTIHVLQVNQITPGVLATSQVATLCEGETPAIITGTAATTGIGTISYQWQQSINNITWADINGATFINYSSGTLTQTTHFRRIDFANYNGSRCSSSTNSIRIAVQARVDPGTISNANQTICGTLPNDMVLTGTGTGGTITYQWQQSTDRSFWANIPGATTTTLSFPSGSPLIPTVTSYYRVVVTNMDTVTCTSISDLATITVQTPSIITLTSSSTSGNSFCDGDTVMLTATGGGTYEFFIDNTSVQGPSTVSTYTHPTALSNSVTATVIVSNSGCSTQTSIRLIKDVLVAGTISGTVSTCFGGNAVFTSLSSGTINGVAVPATSTTNYQWQSSTDNINWRDILQGTTSTSTYTAVGLTQSTYFRRRIVNPSSNIRCDVYSNSFLVTVAPDLRNSGVTSPSQVVCVGDTPTRIIVTGGTGAGGGLSYQWQQSIDLGVTFTDITGATGASYLPPSTLTTSTHFRRATRSTAVPSCMGYSTVHVLQVNRVTPGVLATSQVATLCEGGTPAAITGTAATTGIGTISYQWQQSVNNVNWTDISGAAFINYSPGALTQTTHFRRIDFANYNGSRCSSSTNSIRIAVQARVDPGTISNANQTICGTLPNDMVLTGTGTGGTITYQWQQSTDRNIWANIAVTSTTLSFPQGAAWIPTVTSYYRVVVTNMDTVTCTSISDLATITVQTLSIITLTSSSTSGNSFCDGDTVMLTATGGGTYEFFIDNTSVQGPSRVSTYTHPTALSNSVTATVIVSNSGCSTQTSIRLIKDVLVAGTISGTVSTCFGGNAVFTSLSSGTINGVAVRADSTTNYQWQSSTDNINWRDILQGTTSTSTYTSGGLTQSTYFRRRIVNPSSNIRCDVYSNSFLVTVAPDLRNSGVTSPSQVVCVGDTPTRIIVTGGTGAGGGLSYQWQQSTDLGVTFTDITGATGASYLPPSTLTTSTHFRRATRSTAVPSCMGYSTVHVLQVNRVTPGVLATPQVATLCEGETPAAITGTAATTGIGTISYQWQQSINNITWADISGATFINYSSGTLTQTTHFRRIDFANYNGSRCSSSTNSIRITVQARVDPGTISNANQTICGTLPNDMVLTGTGTGGTITYQWQQSTDRSVWANIAGATTTMLSFPSGSPLIPTVTSYYRVVVTNMDTVTCTSISDLATITVQTPSIITLTSSSTSGNSFCDGDTVMLTATGGGTYEFFIDNTSVQGPSRVSTYTHPTALSNSVTATVIVSNSGCSTQTSIRLIKDVLVAGTISGTVSTCFGGNAVFTSLSSGTINGVAVRADSTTNYQWQSSTDNINWNDILQGTTSTSTYTSVGLTQSTYFRRRIVNPSSNIRCDVYSNPFLVTVAPDLRNSGVTSPSQVVCVGDTPTRITVTGGTGAGAGISYQWQQSIDLGVTFTDITGATGASYLPPSTLTTSTHFRRATQSTRVPSCIGYSTVHVLQVNQVTPGVLATPQVATLCEGGTPAAITGTAATTGIGTISYQWQQSVNNITWTDITGATFINYSPGALTQTTHFRRIDFANYNGSRCSSPTNSIRITVQARFNPGTISNANQTICGTLPNDMVLTGTAATGGTITYQWQQSTDRSVWANIAATSTILSFPQGAAWIPTVTSYYRVMVTSAGVITCTSISDLATITIQTIPRVTLTSSSTSGNSFCDGDTVMLTATGGGTYEFFIDNTSVQGPSTVSTYTHPTALSNSVTATVIIASSGCSTQTSIRLIKDTLVAGVISGTVSTCFGGNAVFTSTASGVINGVAVPATSTTNYQWQSSTDNINWRDIIRGTTSITSTYTAVGLTQSTYFRRRIVNPSSNIRCDVYSNPFLVTVAPDLRNSGVTSPSQVVCVGDTPTRITVTGGTGAGAGISYQWQQSIDLGVTFTDITGATGASYLPPSTLTTSTHFRRATQSTRVPSCMGYSTVHVLQVNQITPGVLATPQVATLCEGGTPAAITGTAATTGIGTISYQWQQSINNITWADISGATFINYSPGALTQTTHFRRVDFANYNGSRCSSPTNSIRITVQARFNPGTISNANQMICGTLPNDMVLTGTAATGGRITYQWQQSTDRNIWADIAVTSTTLSFPQGAAWIPTVTSYYRVMVTSAGVITCTSISDLATITIQTIPTITLTSTSTSGNSFCDGDTVMLTATGGSMYEFFIDNTSVQGPSTVSTYTHPTALSNSVTATVIVTNTRCVTQTSIRLIKDTLVAGVISGTVSTCFGGNAVFTSTASGVINGVAVPATSTTNYQWQSSTDNINWRDITLGLTSTSTYTAVGLTQSTYFRRRIVNPSSNIRCDVYSNPFLVTVAPDLRNSGVTSPSQVVCVGDTPTRLTVTGGVNAGAGISYQWQQSIDSGVTFTDITGATGASYLPPSTLTTSTHFRRATQSTRVPSCIGYSTVHVLQVNQITPGVLATPQVATLCEGGTPATIIGAAATTNIGTISYQWQQSINNFTWTDISGATFINYSPGSLTQTTHFRRIDFTNYNGSRCSSPTNSIRIAVQARVNPGTISNANQTICGTLPNDMVLTGTGTGGTITYQWQQSTDRSVWANIAATSTILSFPQGAAWIPTVTSYYRVVVTNMDTVTCTSISGLATITVQTIPTVTFTSNSTSGNTFCDGETVILTATGGGTYEFFISNILVQASSTANTYTRPTALSNSVTATVIVTNSSCITRREIFLIKEDLDPGVISGTTSTCFGGNAVFTSTASGVINGVAVQATSTTNYRWQSSTDNSNWNDILQGITSTSTYTAVGLTQNTYFRRKLVSISNGKSCEVYTNPILVNVAPDLRGATITPPIQTVCVSDTPTMLTVTGGAPSGAGISYQWQQSINSGATFTDITGAIGVNYTPPALTMTTQFRRATISSISPTSCIEYSTIHVAQVNQIYPGILATSQAATLCEGSTPATLSGTTATSTLGTLTYQWQQSSNNFTWANINGATSVNYSPGSLTQTTYFRRVAFANYNGSRCSSATNSIPIIIQARVNPGTISNGNQIICTALPTDMVLTGTGTGGRITYQWQQSTDRNFWANVPGATTTTLSFPTGSPLIPTVTTYYRVVVTNMDTVTCTSISNLATITVQTIPAVTLTSNSTSGNTFCDGETVMLTAVGGIGMYQFFINNISVQGPSTQMTYTHPVFLSSNATATVIVTNGGCALQREILLTKDDLTPGSVLGATSICFGTDAPTFTSAVAGTINGVQVPANTAINYQWQSSLDNAVWRDISSGTGTSVVYTARGLTQSTYFRRKVINVSNGKSCEVYSNSVLITVAPDLSGATISPANQVVCEGDIPTPLTVTGGTPSGASISYQWQQSTNSGGSFMNITGATGANYAPTALTTNTQFRRATISSIAPVRCIEYSTIHEILVNHIYPGILDTRQSITICHGTNPPTLSVGASGRAATSTIGTLTYQWQQSTNNVNWADITGATSFNYSPGALTQNTYFRRMSFANYNGSRCGDPTNAILITVNNEITPAGVIGTQTICEGTLPTSLRLSGGTSVSRLTYQWQQSTDNIAFTNIANTTSNLDFTANTNYNPSGTTFYRAIITSTTVPACTVTSTAARITVIPQGTITQIAGPGPNVQSVCMGSPIISAVFEYGGGATGLTITPSVPTSGINFVRTGASSYTLMGTPTADIDFTITTVNTAPCFTISTQYRIEIIGVAVMPTTIRKSLNRLEDTVYQQGGVWQNNTLCQDPNTSVITDFYVSPDLTSPVAPTTLPVYDWEIRPGNAGVINSNTGSVTWNPAFSGTATISVRELGCGGNSPWLHTPIYIIPFTTPPTLASSITIPAVVIPSFYTQSGLELGEIPTCQVTPSTRDTKFFSNVVGGHRGIEWSIENVAPGGGISGVTSPGTIGSFSAIVDWNDGFWGSLDIRAQVINCNGSRGVSAIRTINIGQEDATTPTILVDAPTLLPSCPPSGNYQTRFTATAPVSWSLDNSAAGTISPINSTTASLVWNNNFSGQVSLTATSQGNCRTGTTGIIIIVPGRATLDVGPVPALADVTVCQGSLLSGIEYQIGGFPNSANVINLPRGITSTFTATHHIVDIIYSGTTNALNQLYLIQINGQIYEYRTVAVSESAATVVAGLANAINTFPGSSITANIIGGNTLQIRPTVAGVFMRGTVRTIIGAVTVNIRQVARPIRTLTLTGTVTAEPGTYDYTVTTTGGAPNCQQISRIGRITVTGVSTAVLTGTNNDQTICFGQPISTITYTVSNAAFAVANGLPPGVRYDYSVANGLVISGTPSEDVTTTREYVYTVETTNNANGCLPEVSITGTITVEPRSRLTLTSAVTTTNQSICNSGPVSPFVPIVYTLGGDAINYIISSATLPLGLSATFSPTARTVTISGTILETVTTTTVYSYTITTTGNVACTIPTVVTDQITVNPNPIITLTSALGTDNQTDRAALCDGSSIISITYELGGGASNVITNGRFPRGITQIISGTTVVISGTLSAGVTATTTYSYVITTTGNICQPQASVSGEIEVRPRPTIQLTSAVTTTNQTICNSGPVSPFVPIVYALEGDATGYNISSTLPSGITATYDTTNRILTISGTPTAGLVTTTTVYSYTITSTGNIGCIPPAEVMGQITINPNSSLTLTSALGTDDQRGTNAVCDNTAITPIVYELFGTTQIANASGLPPGMAPSVVGTSVTISGVLSTGVTTNTTYSYTITTTGNICQPEVSVSGVIEVLPLKRLERTSPIGTDNQVICNSGSVNPLTPIVYTLDGAATGFNISALPAGITAVLSPTVRTITISGTPTTGLVTTTTVYSYTITTTGASTCGLDIVATGQITIMPNSSLTLTSTLGTDDQRGANAVCDNTAITPIVYELFGATQIVHSGLPPGMAPSVTGTSVTISGVLSTGVEVPTVYSYTITTTGNICQPEVSVSGVIEVLPVKRLERTSPIGTDNQVICNSGLPNALTPIVYTLGGAATGFNISNLPAGITAVLSPTVKTITISGTPTTGLVTTTTIYSYTITTTGISTCGSDIVATGQITIMPNSTIRLVSPAGRDNQSGLDAICDGTAIVPITYELGGGATQIIHSGLPRGVVPSVAGTSVTISGTISAGVTTTTTYSYTITTTGNICQPEVSISGEIEVLPTQMIRLTSPAGTDNSQAICNSGSANPLTPIVYTLGGAATGFNISNLPAGITAVLSPTVRTITISGTPTTGLVTTTTAYSYTITTTGNPTCTPATITGLITIMPNSTIRLASPAGTDNQRGVNAVCDGTAIASITYELGGEATQIVYSGLPRGIAPSVVGTSVTISGTLSAGVTTTTTYSYTITTTGNICQPEVSISGAIEVLPASSIRLTSPASTSRQTICESGSMNPLTPIIYVLGGSATGFTATGLPQGITANLNVATREITISGTPLPGTYTTTRVVLPYIIRTTGGCNSTSISGNITINPLSQLTLTSGVTTNDQRICSRENITPIVYTISGTAANAVLGGLPPGVSASQSGSTITITGAPNVTISTTTAYSYTISTTGSFCAPEAVMRGIIRVDPAVIIDNAYITANDITNLTCVGTRDGSITIPSTPTADFNLRIRGGVSPVTQVDRITLNAQPALGDVYNVIINGITYTHTVIASSFGGATQTTVEVSQALVNEINSATGPRVSFVTAVANTNPTSIRLTADSPGIPFTYSANLSTSITGPASSVPSLTLTNVVSNVTTNYSYNWTGPNGFSSSSLSIGSLEAGTYTLSVGTGGRCISTSSFTVSEPGSLTATTSLCNGGFRVSVSGGRSPYTLRLYNSSNNLISTDITRGIQNYTGLTPGFNYRIEITDPSCAVPTQIAVTIPFEMAFDVSRTVVTPDYCNELPNNIGSGSIQLATTGGSAFTGGSGNFEYSWTSSNGNTFNTRDITGLLPGDYTVTVRDRILGCTGTQNFVIPPIDVLAITAPTVTLNSAGNVELACAGDTTSLQINVAGGSGSYQYSWERNGVTIAGQTTQQLQNIGAGRYTVVVTNVPPPGIDPNNLCRVTRVFNVVSPQPLAVTLNTSRFPVANSCQNALFSMPITISGGTPPYTLNLNSGVKMATTSSPTYIFTDLNPQTIGANLSLSITDASMCSTTATASVNVPISYQFDTVVTDIDCRNNVLGQLKTTVTPSIPASLTLVVQWLSANLNRYSTWNSSQGLITNLTFPGSYRMLITTPDGCELYNQSFNVRDLSGQSLMVNITKEQGLIDCTNTKGRIELEIMQGSPPYTITWERMAPSSTTFVDLPGLSGNAIVTGLDIGTYRATINDASSTSTATICQGKLVTRNIVLKNESFMITDLTTNTLSTTCIQGASGGSVSFKIINTLSNPNNAVATSTFDLDGTLLTLGSGNFTFDAQRRIYTISNIAAGSHVLTIRQGLVAGCVTTENFTIPDNAGAIIYSGEIDYTLGVCSTTMVLSVNASDVTGGVPIVVNNSSTYDYSWRFTPQAIPGQPQGVIQNFVGSSILRANPGSYELTIRDRRGCTNDLANPIVIKITTQASVPFSVTGALTDSNNNKVTNIPDDCVQNSTKGIIGINISGGIRPYEIKWYYRQTAGTQVGGYAELPNFANSTILQNIDPGSYRYVIRSLQASCSLANTDRDQLRYSYLEGVIELPSNPNLYILSGPFIENQDLCQLKPGKITVEVFDNNQSSLTFTYEGVALQLDANQRTPNTYTLILTDPKELGTLRIMNEDGCVIERTIDLKLGDASFKFNSASKSSSNIILARENVTFENTSTLPYSHFEFFYGDNSDSYNSLTPMNTVAGTTTSTTATSTVVTPTGTGVTVNTIPPHKYPSSGTYRAMLRIYNNAGCYNDEIVLISIGQGYSIRLPNVFTPNNDGVNDSFRPIVSGLIKLDFSVFDYSGSLLHAESVQGSPTNLVGLASQSNTMGVVGWDGANANNSPYYVYSVEGTLIDGTTKVERSGTFILLK